MATAPQVEVRPRTTGEILDDAWRLYLADAPVLLALSGLFLVPGLAAWGSAAAVHPLLAAGGMGLWAAFRAASQEAQRQPGKTGAVVLSRLALLVVAVINLHLLGVVALWIAEHLAGFDTAFLG